MVTRSILHIRANQLRQRDARAKRSGEPIYVET